MTQTVDFYKVLGVIPTATVDEIKSAYRAKAKQYHPDVNKSAEAHDILEPPKREEPKEEGKTIKNDAWGKFIAEIDTEGETNFKIPFGQITKKYGAAYIEFCKAMWEANDGVLSEDEFMRMNGGMPKGFFEKTIKAG